MARGLNDNYQKIMIALGILLIVFVFHRWWKQSRMMAENFYAEVPTHPVGSRKKVLLFYATWCPHCVSLRCGEGGDDSKYPPNSPNPESNWGKFFYPARNRGIDVVEVEADQDSQMVSKYKVQGFPTIKMVVNDNVFDFNGERTPEALNLFLQNPEKFSN